MCLYILHLQPHLFRFDTIPYFFRIFMVVPRFRLKNRVAPKMSTLSPISRLIQCFSSNSWIFNLSIKVKNRSSQNPVFNRSAQFIMISINGRRVGTFDNDKWAHSTASLGQPGKIFTISKRKRLYTVFIQKSFIWVVKLQKFGYN